MKEYKTPTLKVVEVKASAIICASLDNMNIYKDLDDDYKDNAYAW